MDALHLASDHLPVVAEFVFGIDTAVEEIPTNPASFNLGQNYPNPFNPVTTITFSIPRSGRVKLYVENILGKKVAVLTDEFLNSGEYSKQFDGSALSSGVYFYTLEVGRVHITMKLLLLK